MRYPLGQPGVGPVEVARLVPGQRLAGHIIRVHVGVRPGIDRIGSPASEAEPPLAQGVLMPKLATSPIPILVFWKLEMLIWGMRNSRPLVTLMFSIMRIGARYPAGSTGCVPPRRSSSRPVPTPRTGSSQGRWRCLDPREVLAELPGPDDPRAFHDHVGLPLADEGDRRRRTHQGHQQEHQNSPSQWTFHVRTPFHLMYRSR